MVIGLSESLIRSVIIRVINKLQTELDDTMSCYQLIITIPISHSSKTSFEKELLILWNIIIKIYHFKSSQDDFERSCHIVHFCNQKYRE